MNITAILTRRYTAYFIGAVIAVVVDIYLAWGNRVSGDTISEVVRGWAFKNFGVAWAWGVLAGHFFFSRRYPLWEQPTSIIALVTASLVVVILGMIVREKVPLQVLMLLLGALGGYYLWPQQPV